MGLFRTAQRVLEVACSELLNGTLAFRMENAFCNSSIENSSLGFLLLRIGLAGLSSGWYSSAFENSVPLGETLVCASAGNHTSSPVMSLDGVALLRAAGCAGLPIPYFQSNVILS